MSLVKEQNIFLKDISLLITYAEKIGVVLTGGELFRTVEQQRLYVEMGLSNTYNSNHLKRLAIDFNFFIDGELIYDNKNPRIKQLGLFWEFIDNKNKWGGNHNNFIDSPHFERVV